MPSNEIYEEVMAFRSATKHIEGVPISDGGHFEKGVHIPKGCVLDGGKVVRF